MIRKQIIYKFVYILHCKQARSMVFSERGVEGEGVRGLDKQKKKEIWNSPFIKILICGGRRGTTSYL